MIKNGKLHTEKKPSLVELEPPASVMNAICDRIPARLVLYFLSWSGFLVSFVMRNDINFAITVMVKPENLTNSINTQFNDSSTLNHTTHPIVI